MRCFINMQFGWTLAFLALLATIATADRPSQRRCYHPSGNLADGHFACGPDSEGHVNCCYKDDVCLDNKLCFGAFWGLVLAEP